MPEHDRPCHLQRQYRRAMRRRRERGLGRVDGLVWTVVIAAVIGILSIDMGPSPIQKNEQAALAAKLTAAAAEERKRCVEWLPGQRVEYDRLMAARKYWDASGVLRRCADELGDESLKALVRAAELKSHHATLQNPKAPAVEKVQAAEWLARDFPAEGKQYESKLPGWRVLAAAEAKRAEVKRRKSEGVRIGMSEEDVLASSWGRPERINRTIRADGVTEQWVYDGRNFLYFENGKLKTIQN